MIAFIEEHRAEIGVEPICRELPIAPSTFYDHLAKRADPERLSDRAKRDAELRPEIRRVFEANWRVYGVRKVWCQLGREGVDVARCTEARLMKDMGLHGAIRGKPHRTTIPEKKAACPLDRVNRQFRVPATCVATWQGVCRRRLRDRRLCPAHCRLARGPHRPCRVCSRCPGAGRSPAPAGSGSRAPQRPRVAIPVDQIHRTARRGRHRALGRQCRRQP